MVPKNELVHSSFFPYVAASYYYFFFLIIATTHIQKLQQLFFTVSEGMQY